MKKKEFLDELRNRLAGMSKEELENRISFYEESIEDRMDEGKSEDEAVAEIGTVDEVLKQIVNETPLVKLIKEKVKLPSKLEPWHIALIVLGFPIWLPLLFAAIALLLLSYVLVWVFVIVSYLIELALIGASLSGLVGFVIYLINGEMILIPLGLFVASIGASIIFFYVCKYATKVTLSLSKAIILKIKTRFINKRNR